MKRIAALAVALAALTPAPSVAATYDLTLTTKFLEQGDLDPLTLAPIVTTTHPNTSRVLRLTTEIQSGLELVTGSSLAPLLRGDEPNLPFITVTDATTLAGRAFGLPGFVEFNTALDSRGFPLGGVIFGNPDLTGFTFDVVLSCCGTTRTIEAGTYTLTPIPGPGSWLLLGLGGLGLLWRRR